MAQSPAHQFGQIIGNLLEDVMKPIFQDFCRRHNLYLDTKGQRPDVRKGNKVTWADKYGNRHDLDFVIEKEGSHNYQGKPVAFIEVAWRRYTKHSKNKVQEIQAAISPIVQEHPWDRPFTGAVLAGFFTQNSIEQLQSFGFSVLYFQYETIVRAFHQSGIDIRFDESTSDAEFSLCVQKIRAISNAQYIRLTKNLQKNNHSEIGFFMKQMEISMSRIIEQLIIIPLHGEEHTFVSCAEAAEFIKKFDHSTRNGAFRKYEVMVKFSNGDSIDASFKDNDSIQKFLTYLSD